MSDQTQSSINQSQSNSESPNKNNSSSFSLYNESAVINNDETGFVPSQDPHESVVTKFAEDAENRRQTFTIGDDILEKQRNMSGNPTKWFLAPGIEGEGPKPDFFNEKTFGTLLDQAKALPEARKKLGAFPGAPDEYDIDLKTQLGDEYADYKIDVEDPLFKSFHEFAKEKGMSQDAFNYQIKLYFDNAKSFMPIEQTEQISDDELIKQYVDEERKKIGPNPDKQLADLKLWFEDKYDVPDGLFENEITSYENFRLLKIIKDQEQQSNIPSSAQITTYHDEAMNRSDARGKLLSDPRYGVDPEYNKYVLNKYKEDIEKGFIKNKFDPKI